MTVSLLVLHGEIRLNLAAEVWDAYQGHRADSLGVRSCSNGPRIAQWPTYVDQALRSGSNFSYPEIVPFGSSSDLK
jgi:hypothetical protein